MKQNIRQLEIPFEDSLNLPAPSDTRTAVNADDHYLDGSELRAFLALQEAARKAAPVLANLALASASIALGFVLFSLAAIIQG